jgi:transcriptional regulator with XRE-family HTH domain
MDDNPLYLHFGRELKRLRTKRGWSQEALGKRIGFSDAQVSHVETGTARPSPEFADALDRQAGLTGAFAIFGFPDDSPGMVYMESPDEGMTSRRPATVRKLTMTYDVLRDDAMGARASRDLLREVAEEKWTTD